MSSCSSFFFCRAISNKGAAAAVNSPGASYAIMLLYCTSGGEEAGRQSKFTPGEFGNRRENRQKCVHTDTLIYTLTHTHTGTNPTLVNTIYKEKELW